MMSHLGHSVSMVTTIIYLFIDFHLKRSFERKWLTAILKKLQIILPTCMAGKKLYFLEQLRKPI